MLHAALQPAGDALDETRQAVRRFFSNHTMVAMKQPDEYDLASIESWGLPQLGRPFHASFVSAAEHLLASLTPKVVNGADLGGEMLAATASALVEQINEVSKLAQPTMRCCVVRCGAERCGVVLGPVHRRGWVGADEVRCADVARCCEVWCGAPTWRGGTDVVGLAPTW